MATAGTTPTRQREASEGPVLDVRAPPGQQAVAVHHAKLAGRAEQGEAEVSLEIAGGEEQQDLE